MKNARGRVERKRETVSTTRRNTELDIGQLAWMRCTDGDNFGVAYPRFYFIKTYEVYFY